MREILIAGLAVVVLNIWAVPAAYRLGLRHGRERRSWSEKGGNPHE